MQRVRVASLLESYIFGIARGEIADRTEVLRTGVSRDDYWEARAAFWNTYFDPQRYPAMLATWEAGGFEAEHHSGRRPGLRPRPHPGQRRPAGPLRPG